MRVIFAFTLLLLSAACTPAPPRPPAPLARVVTLAGDGPRVGASGFTDPFGVAVAKDGTVFVTDGKGDRLYRIATDGTVTVAAERLDMPSALAVAPDGALVVANTGAHTIVRVDPATGAITPLAGSAGERGFVDGSTSSARFDAPVGVAVGPDGTVYVADTYNDRIRAIAPDGVVRTIAGGPAPGYVDGAGADARFDTPCGVAVTLDGALVVADTGNARLRHVDANGAVVTIGGADLEEPTGLAMRADGGAVFVADASGSSIWRCDLGPAPSFQRLVGGGWDGRADGDLASAKLSRPTGVAVDTDGALVVADSTNGAVRAVVAADSARGRVVSDPTVAVDLAELRAAIPPRWPYDPPDQTREIAATFGEVRSEGGDHDLWFHAGLDIPGGYGEVARAVLPERVSRPLAALAAGGRSEFLRLPVFSYVHVRIGRDADDRPLPNAPFEVLRDAEGEIARIRVRRGTRIDAGQAIGTLNPVNHVHLSMGPPGAEVNALTVLSLPGLVDTTPPTIEEVTIASEAGEPLDPRAVDGRVRVVARAWDRTDRNAERRRLGVFRLGYQLMGAPGFQEPRATISFERLPIDPRGARFAYGPGSRSWFSGPTVFNYIVTNVVRDGESREDALDLSTLAPGPYTLRVFAEDAFGNRATRDMSLVVRR